MRLEIGRLLAIAGLALAGASACGDAAPDAPAPAANSDPKAICDTVLKARKTALDAFTPVSATLAETNPSADTIAKAAYDLKVKLTIVHADVAAAAENAGDPRLKETILAYQMSVEQAIVDIEGANDEKAKLAAVIDSPARRAAEQAVASACA